MESSAFVPIDTLSPARSTRPREPGPRPPWLKVSVRRNAAFAKLERTAREHHLHTVCEEARCPNIYECWSRGTATFMLMGDLCSRHCGFCSVGQGELGPLDAGEPEGVAESIATMGIQHAVITSVNRDDLPDGGAAHIAETIRTVRRRCPQTTIEMLVPDFCGDEDAVNRVLDADPDVFAHNTETVPRLYSRVRPEARYAQSLRVLKWASRRRDARLREAVREFHLQRVKSGIMVGLGESLVEVRRTIDDLRSCGVDVLTVGQYLAPTPRHLPVERFVPPREFEEIRTYALSIGFAHVESGPLVRSSYRAERAVRQNLPAEN